MPDYAYDRLEAGEAMPGMFVLGGRLGIGHAIDQILLIVDWTAPAEWTGQMQRLPL